MNENHPQEQHPEALQKIKEELEACRAEREEYLNGWQRARADFTNLKQEGLQEQRRAQERRENELVLKIVPLADAFEAAFAQDGWQKIDVGWRAGIESIHREFMKFLEELSIESFDPTGENFDPAHHVAIAQAEGEEGRVVKVERKGYQRKGAVLRPAYVVVGTGQSS